jgi:hypothetical protein
VTKITQAISLRSPWWWFILYGGKDVENRDWPTRFRGTVYLHSSSWWKGSEIFDDVEFGCSITGRTWELMREQEELKRGRGCIVGTVEIVDCVTTSDSPWFFGKYGFVLRNPVAFSRRVPCKGALKFFQVPDDVLAQLETATTITKDTGDA